FGTTAEAQLLGRGGLHADPADLAAEVSGEVFPHRLRVWPDLRRLGDHRDIRIAQRVTMLHHQRCRVAQELAAVRIAPARIGGRKMPADVAQGQRTENRIAQGVDHHVAVGMRNHAPAMRHAHAADDDMVARAEGVYVKPATDAHHAVLSSRNSASAKSAAVVTLMLSSAPSTSKGAKPACS